MRALFAGDGQRFIYLVATRVAAGRQAKDIPRLGRLYRLCQRLAPGGHIDRRCPGAPGQDQAKRQQDMGEARHQP